MSGELDETANVTLRDVKYIASWRMENDLLSVCLEEQDTAQRWRGDFSSAYVEEMTHKTGNFKKFPIFVKMLASSLRHQSDSVYIDLLTHADLEALKSRHAKAAAAKPNPVGKSNKRYLILTYAVEFDRVHYPLPLTFDEQPEPKALMRTIARLRHELDVTRNSQPATSAPVGATPVAVEDVAELRVVRAENTELREQLRSAQSRVGKHSAVTQATDEVIRELQTRLQAEVAKRQELVISYEAQQKELEREVRQYRREAAELTKENKALSAELSDMRANSSVRDEGVQKQLRVLQKQLRRAEEIAEEERNKAQRDLQTAHREVGSLREQSAKAAVAMRELRTNNRQLEQEVDALRRRADVRQAAPPRSSSAAAAAASAAPPRPGSATFVRSRFDPTAYVRDRWGRSASADRARSASPGGSRSNSPSTRSADGRPRRSSSAQRRAELERERLSAPLSRARPRPASAERLYDRPWSVPGSRAGSSESRPSSRARAERRALGASSRSPSRGSASASGAAEPVRVPVVKRERRDLGTYDGRGPLQNRTNLPTSSSPSKQTLKHTKPSQKLVHAASRPGANAHNSSFAESTDDDADVPAGAHEEDISDIDARLNALQNFLRAAKAKSGK